MKAITEKQPWASLIVEGIKDIENRTWPTKYRGKVLIHAAASSWNIKQLVSYLTPGMVDVLKKLGFNAETVLNKQTGCIIGSVEIIDCLINHPSIWAIKTEGVTDINTNEFIPKIEPKPTYNWVLANPILFPEPITAKGKLSFWDYPNILAEPEEKGGELFCHCQLPVKEENQVMSMGGGEYRCRYCGGKWYK